MQQEAPEAVPAPPLPAVPGPGEEASQAPLRDTPGDEAPSLLGELRRTIIAGAMIIGFGVCGVGIWAAVAPLAGAAIAPGVVSPEGSRRTIQHLEGGIIKRILIDDGSRVRAGEPLILLEDTQAQAGFALLKARHHSLVAAQARMAAEQAGHLDVRFPDWLIEAAGKDATALEAMVAQRQLFRTRAEGLAGRRGILKQRIAQLREEIRGLEAQIAADDRQIELIAEEIEGLDQLYRKGLAPRTRLLALQRAQSDIEGDRAERQARIARAHQAIGETELQMIAQGTALLDDASEEISRVQTDLAEVEQQLAASQDVLARMTISAPNAGTVVELRFHTQGGVINPGEPILDIVPVDEELLVEARVSPLDIDIVAPGLPALIMLPAFKQRTAPRFEGRVRSVSADAIVDQRTGERYFAAWIEADPGQLEALAPEIELMAGMTAEVFIAIGERTMLDYLLQPIFDSMRRAFREA